MEKVRKSINSKEIFKTYNVEKEHVFFIICSHSFIPHKLTVLYILDVENHLFEVLELILEVIFLILSEKSLSSLIFLSTFLTDVRTVE